MTQTIRQTHSLRRVFWVALLPLSVLMLSSIALLIVMVQRVHHNVECMYVETREIAQARTLADELRGIETWVTAAPTLPPAAREAADADALQHLDTATDIARRFAPGSDDENGGLPDPSDPDHEANEESLARMIRTELDLLQRLLADPSSGLELADPHVRSASRAALALAAAIEHEARELGANLVQSSEEFVRIVTIIAAMAVLTLFGAALLFQRRILRPLAELRHGVLAVGDGNLDLQLPIRHNDELGILAATLQSMTRRLRRQQEDLEERVAQRTSELLRTARLADLGTLAAGVAHEINNPLAAIATCAEGLLRDQRSARVVTQGATADPQRAAAGGAADARNADPSSRTREYLEIIAKEAMRVRDTTARLLAFARPESGRREPVWLEREVRDVATMLDHSATRADVRMELDLPASPPPVLGDPADMRQVVFNLLKNALDASPPGSRIGVSLEVRDEDLVLRVVDEGGGVPGALKERIFEPFVTTKAPGSGTGLGLAISHRIVTDHGGSLRVRDEPGGGACFELVMPRLRV
ncbi:MAG: sensor histidine kinase [Planctomycetota bacterium]